MAVKLCPAACRRRENQDNIIDSPNFTLCLISFLEIKVDHGAKCVTSGRDDKTQEE